MLSSSLRRGALALSLLFMSSLCQAGLVPRLVRDVDETSYAGSSSPRQFTGLNHGMAFTAFEGRELWIYDDRDDVYGPALQRAEIRQLRSGVYAAREAAGGWSFWHTLGFPYYTAAPFSTGRVGRLGAIFQDPVNTVFGPMLFEAGEGSGLGLWTLSADGPIEIARPLPLEDGRLARDYLILGDKAFFIARHHTLGTALWKTDGTAAGTSPVAAPSPGRTVSLHLAGLLREDLLVAISGGEPELWWSDGTPHGLRPFTEIVHGRRAATVTAARVVDGRAFLVVDDGRHGRQLWTSDGTAAGTLAITRFAPDPLRQIDLPVLQLDGRWLFSADDGVHGRELWRTDGTRQGTRLAIDLCPGPCSSDPRDLSYGYFSGPFTAAFTASGPEGQRALWRTDGTLRGTSRITPPGVEATTGLLLDGFFAARDAALGEEMWITDGSPETTRLWVDLGLQKDSGSNPYPIGAAGDRLLFRTYSPVVGYGLWTSDGTADGTFQVPVPPGPRMGSSDLLSTATLGERMLFVGPVHVPSGRNALWSTDGTAAGIVRLTPPGVIVQSAPFTAGPRVFFFADDAEHGTELWVSEGDPESTRLLVDFVPGPESADLDLFTFGRLRGQLLFRRWGDDSHLWISDGTAAGTRRLVDADPLLEPLERFGGAVLAETGDKLFFLGTSAAGDNQLWVSDGTAAGTAPLDFADAAGTAEDLFLAAHHLLYFKVRVYDSESEESTTHLWITDGTPAGTIQVPAQPLGSFSYGGMRPVPFGDRLLYVNEDSYFWVTDGTAAGTFPLLDPQGHGIYDYYGDAIDFKNHLVFATGDGACYVWNGTGATVQQLDLACGAFLAVGDRLFFSGFQTQTGAELWVMEEK